MTPTQQQQRLEARLALLRHDPLHCAYRHVSRAARAVAAAFDDAFAPQGLTAGQFTVLMTLGRLGPMNIGRLAQQLAMDTTTVPRVLKPLLDRKSVIVERGKDRRVRVVSITEQGVERVLDALPLWERAQARMLEGFSEGQWSEVRHGIAALRYGRRRREKPEQEPKGEEHQA